MSHYWQILRDILTILLGMWGGGGRGVNFKKQKYLGASLSLLLTALEVIVRMHIFCAPGKTLLKIRWPKSSTPNRSRGLRGQT